MHKDCYNINKVEEAVGLIGARDPLISLLTVVKVDNSK